MLISKAYTNAKLEGIPFVQTRLSWKIDLLLTANRALLGLLFRKTGSSY
jgi:hypothetical protein